MLTSFGLKPDATDIAFMPAIQKARLFPVAK
jgi:hypothetical protein